MYHHHDLAIEQRDGKLVLPVPRKYHPGGRGEECLDSDRRLSVRRPAPKDNSASTVIHRSFVQSAVFRTSPTQSLTKCPEFLIFWKTSFFSTALLAFTIICSLYAMQCPVYGRARSSGSVVRSVTDCDSAKFGREA
jgi:hypothetical protein